MVGAIADWFAVTALFKHPLGLPIPHTALIPKRKDELGPGPRGVRRRELPPGGDHPRPGRRPRRSRCGWAVARRAAQRAPGGRRGRRRRRDRAGPGADEHIAELVERCWCRGSGRSRSRRCSAGFWPRWSATTCTTALVDLGPRGAAPLAGREPGDRRRDARRARALVGAAPAQRGGDRTRPPRAGRAGSRTSAPTRATTPGEALDSMLAQLGQDLLYDPDTQERAEALKERLLDHPQLLATGISLWNALRRALLGRSRDPAGPLRDRLAEGAGRPSPSGWSPTSSCAPGSTGWPRTPRSSSSTGTAPS